MDTRLAYTNFGGGLEGRSGALLLHGLGNSKSYWDPVGSLLDTPSQVLAADLPGFGGSRHLPSRSSLESLTTLLESFSVSEWTIVGHSLGGFYALELAAHLGELVKRVVLVDATLYRAYLALRDPVEYVGRSPKFALTLAAQFAGALVPFQVATAQLLADSEILRKATLWPFVASPGDLDRSALLPALSGNGGASSAIALLGTARGMDLGSLLRSVQQEVYSVRGESDRLIDQVDIEFYSQNLDRFKQDIQIPGAGHWPMLEQPERLAELLKQIGVWE